MRAIDHVGRGPPSPFIAHGSPVLTLYYISSSFQPPTLPFPLRIRLRICSRTRQTTPIASATATATADHPFSSPIRIGRRKDQRGKMLHNHGVLCGIFLLLLPPVLQAALPVLPNPDPIQPFFVAPSPPSTVHASPEQSDLSTCPLDLPAELFPSIDASCGSAKNRRLDRARCCPVLAVWTYSAYSREALIRAGRLTSSSAEYDQFPVLPDDSEACVGSMEAALRGRGVALLRPNDTCDAFYCGCGIRLRVPSCVSAFTVARKGRLVGDRRVRSMEEKCGTAGSAVEGCTRCLRSLRQLNGGKGRPSGAGSESERRKKSMQERDCELMGLIWLLAKNRTLYMPTVSAVLRTIMTGAGDGDGSQEPVSCTVGRDGMPLAVDSAELDGASSSSSSIDSHFLHLYFSLVFLLCCFCNSHVL